MKFRPIASISPRTIEAIAVSLFIVVLLVGGWAFYTLPKDQFTREAILKLIEAIVGSLGVVSLLLVWAQLRHTAILARLLCYHQYFHDLPNNNKVRELYKVLDRCKVAVPKWHAPLSEADTTALVGDGAPPPDTAELVVREYLNDFEEFASAINSGLIDEDYAYKLEATRALNAYYGFQQMVHHWHAEDKRISLKSGGVVPATTHYYGELRSVAERWKIRKQDEMARENRAQDRMRIAEKL